MTEDDARKRICPFLPTYQDAPQLCLASGCMAWRVSRATAAGDFGRYLQQELHAGGIISAIKAWRQEYGATLKDAKDAIDEIIAGSRPLPAGEPQGYCGCAGEPK